MTVTVRVRRAINITQTVGGVSQAYVDSRDATNASLIATETAARAAAITAEAAARTAAIATEAAARTAAIDDISSDPRPHILASSGLVTFPLTGQYLSTFSLVAESAAGDLRGRAEIVVYGGGRIQIKEATGMFAINPADDGTNTGSSHNWGAPETFDPNRLYLGREVSLNNLLIYNTSTQVVNMFSHKTKGFLL
jgi:hypothetical protein